MSPNFKSSSAYPYSLCWLSLWAVSTEQVCMESVWLCQFWSTTLRWWRGCGWGHWLCTCTRNWSSCLCTSAPDTLLLYHLSVGVSSQTITPFPVTIHHQILLPTNSVLCTFIPFTAVAPIVPVVISLAIDRDFMVTYSPPTDRNTEHTIR